MARQTNISYEWDSDGCGWVAGWIDPEQGYMTAWLLPGILVSPLEDPEDLREAAVAEGAPEDLPVERPVDPDDPVMLRDLLERMESYYSDRSSASARTDLARAILDIRMRLDDADMKI